MKQFEALARDALAGPSSHFDRRVTAVTPRRARVRRGPGEEETLPRVPSSQQPEAQPAWLHSDEGRWILSWAFQLGAPDQRERRAKVNFN